MTIDIRTLFAVSAPLFACFSITALYLWRSHRSMFKGIGHWSLGFALLSLSGVLFSLRHVLHDIFSIVAANSLLILAFALLFDGISLFAERNSRRILNYIVLAGVVVLFVYYGLVSINLTARIIIISAAYAYIQLHAAVLTFGFRDEEAGDMYLLNSVMFASLGIFFASRVLITTFVDPGSEFMKSDLYQSISVLVHVLGGTPIGIGLILLVNSRLGGIKERAQEEVRRERDLIDHIMETSPVGVTVVSREGQITFANRRAQEILGLEKDKITKRHYNAPEWKITDFEGEPFPEEDLPFMKVMNTMQPVLDVRHAIQWPDGKMIKLSINAAPMLNERGEFDGMVASIEDITEGIASMDALRISEERFRSVIQSSPMGMHMYRLEEGGRLVFTGANPAANSILGVDHSQFIGKTIEEAFPPLAETDIPAIYRKVCEDGTPWHTEQINYEHGKISGAYEVHAFQTVPGTMAALFLDITERLLAQEQVRDSLKMKETLLKEIHHRVKNNLQVISGLLDLQTHHVEDEKYRKIFKESQNRVLAMALIHQELYRAEDLESIDFGEFIRNLSRGLVGSYTMHSDMVKLEYDVEDMRMVIDTAIPCGLIINELVSNSLKHAFPEGSGGTISISLRTIGEREYELEVKDDGIGLSKDLDISQTASLGLKLVATLSEQLRSEVIINRKSGTSFTFRFIEYREAGSILH